MLFNCSSLVDVSSAEYAVRADKDRELGLILDKDRVNADVGAAIRAGAVVSQSGVSEVDAFMCGEREALRALPFERVIDAIEAAASAGQADAMVELLARSPDPAELGYAITASAANGIAAALSALLDYGAEVEINEVSYPCASLFTRSVTGLLLVPQGRSHTRTSCIRKGTC